MTNLLPMNYRLVIEPNLDKFTFNGNTEIRFDASKTVREINLNVLELEIESCHVKNDGRRVSCSFEVDAEKEVLTVRLSSGMKGTIQLDIRYTGTINDKMAGFYRSGYAVDGETRFIAVTQFQESDARRAFPCMDFPAAKATYDIEMIVPNHLTAISNGAVIEETALKNETKNVHFQQTPRMSSYLVFFGVGEFEVAENPEDPRVRAVTLPGMKAYGGFGLDFGQKALRYCEDYYGIPYPLPKLDLLAIPDFAFGAMENWGAITFRENLLLHYPDVTSRLGEARICEVIAHEIAHQWFGNLVTPSDWKYLWLNESFATYFGYGVVDHYYPQWKTWEQFLQSQYLGALNRDSLQETFPIEIPGGEHVVINTSTAPIIYSKGGSILRQIEGFTGAEDFQKGLRTYLKNHEYGCAESRHLWEALEEASQKPITALMKSWIEQPGFPVVEVTREGKDLVLEQHRFTSLPRTYDQLWMIPVTLTVFEENGTERQLTILMEGKKARIELGETSVAYKINRYQTGFYRVWYRDTHNLNRLGKRIQAKTLAPEDRWGLEHDLFSFVKRGDESIENYLGFLGHYENEDAFLPLMSIAENLFQAYLVLDGDARDKICASGKRLVEKTLSAIGLDPQEGESHPTAILRDVLLWHAVIYHSTEATKFTEEQFARLRNGRTVHPDIKKSVMCAGAFLGNKDTFKWFTGRISKAESEHDRMNLLTALGCFREKSLIQETQRYLMEEVPDRNRFIPVVSLCQNPRAIEHMWDWYVTHLNELEKSHPLLYERVIASILPTCGLTRQNEVKAFFNDYSKSHPHTVDVIKLSLEKLEIYLQMRAAVN